MAEAPTNSPAPASYQILPKYPELIFAAIAAVDEKNGANKSSISKQIEATYGSLPAAHSTLLSHHLNKMKASGELIVVKNNYVKPDPNASPKRGRGRPAKPKEPLPEGTVVSPPRPRGRPPKPRDPLAPVPSPKDTAGSTPRPRGRPPKVQNPLAPASSPKGTAVSTPRSRGRPRKVQDPVAPVSSPVAQSPVKPMQPLPEGTVVSSPKPRGRPPKLQDPLAPASSPKKGAQSVSGRKRGRPKKSGGASTAASPPPSGERRGRGRPPKLQTPVAAPVVA